jgi:peptidoglycan/LPS O-acetylase OafA/YrhL
MASPDTNPRDVPTWFDHGRVPCLDGLRAVSISLVLFEHASLTHGFPLGRETHLGDLGRAGVSMFFTISGFLITMLLAREWDRSGAISLKGFYRRRALRILPAYFAFLLVILVLTRTHGVSLDSTDWIGVLTYTVNFIRVPAWEIGHVWSLSVEEQFYLVWPLIVFLLSPRRALHVVVAYLSAAPILRLIIWGFFRSDLQVIDDLTPLRLDAIAAGCMLALLARRQNVFTRSVLGATRGAWVAPAAAMVIVASYVVGHYISAFEVTLAYSVTAAAMAVIVWNMATAPDTTLGRILETRPIVFIGVLSYSLYLWQQLFLNPHNVSWVAAWPINIVLAAGAALVSYYLIESPFLRIKDRSATKAVHAAAKALSSPAIETV